MLAADALVILGLAALTLTVIGLLRMDDPYARVHATAKAVVLGTLAVVAASIFTCSWSVLLEAALVGLFVLLTSAVASHALVRLRRHEDARHR